MSDSLQVYKPVDTICTTDKIVNYPTEFSNSLDPLGVPSHILELKNEAAIMFLRNLHPQSLCKGTRLSVKKLMSNIIEDIIMTGLSLEAKTFTF